MSKKNKGIGNDKKGGAKFHAKHINHDPQAESARAVFGKADSENTVRSDKA